VSIGHRRFRAAIYHYVDIGTGGRSDPRYVKQANANSSDGNWWCSLDQIDGDEVIRGGRPEYRMRAVVGFDYRAVPLTNPKGVAILVVELQQIYVVNAIVPRMVNNQHTWQVRVELYHESLKTATYSDGYYYPD
jgi:hypothetical protein